MLERKVLNLIIQFFVQGIRKRKRKLSIKWKNKDKDEEVKEINNKLKW